MRYASSSPLLRFVEIRRNCEGLLRHLTELTGSIMTNDSLLTDETQCTLEKNQFELLIHIAGF